ncbi:MAG: ASKHA domain-containing protein [Anaerolineaceae bacterium]|nr:ASKHA domain-containing protein [Anaerolineaceae bacterium]
MRPAERNEPPTFQVDLQPVGRRVRVVPGTNLLDAARMAGVDIVASCGGMGICATCQVKLVQGDLSSPTQTEIEMLSDSEMRSGFRLACQAMPTSDVKIDLPAASLVRGQHLQVEGVESRLDVDPAVVALEVHCPEPSLSDQRGDLTRVNAELEKVGYPPLQASLAQYADLIHSLRQHHWSARLVIRPEEDGSHLITELPSQVPLFGLAMDLGSTKLAMYLIDLTTGGTFAAFAIMNTQIAYGEDVVSRIAYANRGSSERKRLQTMLVESINLAVAGQCQKVGVIPEQIADVVAVGNTAMHHFFCGLPVEPLGRAPYVPAVQDALSFAAAEIGLIAAPGARVYLPPNIAGFVGADHVSALLASQQYFGSGCGMLVDIGTNTEISLVQGERILSCSCASGPAFEGAHIQDGMRAAPGAIERITIDHGQLRVFTIGGEAAVGICGSGILNALAEMRKAAVLDQRGVLSGHDKQCFVLVSAENTGHGRDIVVTRKDVNQIQLAKGAIRGGVRTILEKAGISDQHLNSFIIAGAFGTHLDVESAIGVGMFPCLPLDRFHQVGNAAGVGARQMLLSRKKRLEAEALTRRVEYLELTVVPEFTSFYTDSLFFPVASPSTRE